jgi:hypothetical protein
MGSCVFSSKSALMNCVRVLFSYTLHSFTTCESKQANRKFRSSEYALTFVNSQQFSFPSIKGLPNGGTFHTANALNLVSGFTIPLMLLFSSRPY